MRNYTMKVVEKLHFTKRFKLAPFPGRYPTRVLVVCREREKPHFELGAAVAPEIKSLSAFPRYKVIYYGKPNLIELKRMPTDPFMPVMSYEFDKRNLVYAHMYTRNGAIWRTAPSFDFYHSYAQMGYDGPWPWFLTPWRSLRVGNYTAYNHFPDKNADANLKVALLAKLVAHKVGENVNL